jgi:hypothetical protein
MTGLVCVAGLAAAAASMAAIGSATPARTGSVVEFDNDGGGGDGKWSTDTNWVGDSKPTAADRAYIPSGLTCTVDTTAATADTLQVDGTLNIAAGMVLTLENDDDIVGGAGADNSAVDGDIALQGTSSALRLSVADHTFAGSGTLRGEADAAKIQILGGLTFTSEILIKGQLTVEKRSGTGSPTFDNQFQVWSNVDGGTITLGSNLLLADVDDDPSDFEWRVGDSSGGFDAAMRFLKSNGSLNGDFKVEQAGSQLIMSETSGAEVDVATTGILEMDCDTSVFIASSGSSFAHDNDNFSGTCSAPGTPIESTFECDCGG